MRKFEELINEIEVDGVKIVPIIEIAKLAGFPIVGKPNLSKYTEECILKYKNNSEFCINTDYNLFYDTGCWGENGNPIDNQLQIFQKLHEWGFVEMPRPMPNRDRIQEYLNKSADVYCSICSAETILKDFCEGRI